MKAMLSEAFVADHRFSRWRFLATIALLSIAGGVAGWALMWNVFPANQRLVALSHAALTAMFGAIAIFLIGVVVASPIWWLLCRLSLRGWVPSLVAGGLCALALGGAEWSILGGSEAHVTSGDPPDAAVILLGNVPLGLMFGWLIWRLAFVAAPAVQAQTEAHSPPAS